ncbi:MAG: Uma2 family endonuclease [Lachnospiraceae bacterium]|jgi:Uma2 family endonuclease|nr:Uma2 family endonuclease [Lachnospiraceae bacterium]
MALLQDEYQKQEKMNGVIYDMSPSAGYKHGIINNNINTIIKAGLKGSLCLVFMENLDFKYHPEENDDYVIPDIMIICDRKHLKGGSYSGVPKFIAETLSPPTALRDKTDKMQAYEKAGVGEYWIVSPQGKSVEIYYLTEGRYVLTYNYLLQDDEEEEHYNAKTEIALKEFPHITMKLEDIFEGMEP